MSNSVTLDSTLVSEQIVKQLITAWGAQNKSLETLINKYDEAAYLNEIAPGRNRAIYIFGHLVAVNDNILPLLGAGDKLYPELFDLFITNPDKAVSDIPSMAELKKYWDTINTKLNNHINSLSVSDWMGRHTKVSAEDFAKEPHRNKLSILITRTSHLAYHVGQLALLGKKELAN